MTGSPTAATSTGALAGTESRHAPAALTGGTQLPESYWHSLRYFSVYRLVVAGVFFLAATVYGGTPNLGSLDIELFRLVSATYLFSALLMLSAVHSVRRGFDLQLTSQVAVDVGALTLLMYASGGAESGIGVMIFVVLAGAGLVGQGRMAIFYAALATLAALAEQSYHVLRFGEELGAYFRTGLTSIGYFGTAIVARLLARRVIANESLAVRRGIELANQLQINQRVIRDMQDGVLVVAADGRVRQCNPRAEALFGTRFQEGADLAIFSVALSEQFARWIARPAEAEAVLRVAGSQRLLRARFLPPGDGDNSLIYLEDIGRIQSQVQQLKLAALGRLTANMAHEIRNPLSAISHAAELLDDEERADARRRLIRIIGDNTQRLNRIVAEILELGRRDSALPEQIRLGPYLREFVEEFALHDASAPARLRIEGEDATLVFDRGHLHRVLWNLLVNALRHSSQTPAAVRLIMAARDDGNAELHVLDDGPGIEESLRGQVFEPFFTTQGTGTGLGLYIARELCEANGAQLDLLENSPGAHFRIVAKGAR